MAVIIGGYGWFMHTQTRSAVRQNCDALSTGSLPDVVIYGTDWCQFCKKTRWFLDDHAVSYCEYDIEKSATGLRQFQALDGSPIPLVMINEQRVEGLNKPLLKQVLIDQGLLASESN